jgi:hypothetical protein
MHTWVAKNRRLWLLLAGLALYFESFTANESPRPLLRVDGIDYTLSGYKPLINVPADCTAGTDDAITTKKGAFPEVKFLWRSAPPDFICKVSAFLYGPKDTVIAAATKDVRFALGYLHSRVFGKKGTANSSCLYSHQFQIYPAQSIDLSSLTRNPSIPFSQNVALITQEEGHLALTTPLTDLVVPPHHPFSSSAPYSLTLSYACASEKYPIVDQQHSTSITSHGCGSINNTIEQQQQEDEDEDEGEEGAWLSLTLASSDTTITPLLPSSTTRTENIQRSRRLMQDAPSSSSGVPVQLYLGDIGGPVTVDGDAGTAKFVDPSQLTFCDNQADLALIDTLDTSTLNSTSSPPAPECLEGATLRTTQPTALIKLQIGQPLSGGREFPASALEITGGGTLESITQPGTLQGGQLYDVVVALPEDESVTTARVKPGGLQSVGVDNAGSNTLRFVRDSGAPQVCIYVEK